MPLCFSDSASLFIYIYIYISLSLSLCVPCILYAVACACLRGQLRPHICASGYKPWHQMCSRWCSQAVSAGTRCWLTSSWGQVFCLTTVHPRASSALWKLRLQCLQYSRLSHALCACLAFFQAGPRSVFGRDCCGVQAFG